jgi:hypothetical protein
MTLSTRSYSIPTMVALNGKTFLLLAAAIFSAAPIASAQDLSGIDSLAIREYIDEQIDIALREYDDIFDEVVSRAIPPRGGGGSRPKMDHFRPPPPGVSRGGRGRRSLEDDDLFERGMIRPPAPAPPRPPVGGKGKKTKGGKGI